MVRSIHKVKNAFLAVASAVTILSFTNAPVQAQTQDVELRVNLVEALSITVTNPDVWASGNTNEFLRNKVTVSAATNNSVGVTVSMYADGTSLINQSGATDTIPSLSGTVAASAFETNTWGYSLDDADTASSSATYNQIITSSNPKILPHINAVKSGTDSVFFGAKADTSVASGTYAQKVHFVAVTGTIDTTSDPANPQIPTNPSHDNPVNEIATYTSTTGVGTAGQTTYTTRTTSGTGDAATTATTTQVTAGNTVDSYQNPAGVTTTVSSGTSVVAALGVAAAVAATSGFFFFIVAKRRRDDDEEEEEAQQ